MTYCHCGRKSTFDPDKQDYIEIERKPRLFWFCDICGNPSHAVQAKEPAVYAPPGAVQVRDVRIDIHGISHVTWSLGQGKHITTINYLPYPRRSPSMATDHGRDHLLKMWGLLDIEVKSIREATHAEFQEHAKARAGAIADIIYILMHEYYPNREAITREALARYADAKAGTPHETPGLAEEIWDPAVRFKDTAYSEASESKARGVKTAPTPKGNRVPDAAVDTARNGIIMGMFTVKQMADTYNMTEQELKTQLNLD